MTEISQLSHKDLNVGLKGSMWILFQCQLICKPGLTDCRLFTDRPDASGRTIIPKNFSRILSFTTRTTKPISAPWHRDLHRILFVWCTIDITDIPQYLFLKCIYLQMIVLRCSNDHKILIVNNAWCVCPFEMCVSRLNYLLLQVINMLSSLLREDINYWSSESGILFCLLCCGS